MTRDARIQTYSLPKYRIQMRKREVPLPMIPAGWTYRRKLRFVSGRMSLCVFCAYVLERHRGSERNIEENARGVHGVNEWRAKALVPAKRTISS